MAAKVIINRLIYLLYLSIGQLVGFLQGGGGSSSGHFLFKVKGDIAQFFLDVTNDFTLSCWLQPDKRNV
jgi:hypothetical protein